MRKIVTTLLASGRKFLKIFGAFQLLAVRKTFINRSLITNTLHEFAQVVGCAYSGRIPQKVTRGGGAHTDSSQDTVVVQGERVQELEPADQLPVAEQLPGDERQVPGRHGHGFTNGRPRVGSIWQGPKPSVGSEATPTHKLLFRGGGLQGGNLADPIQASF